MVVDYSALATSAETQITAAIPVALGVMGLILGVMVGIKVFKRVL